MTRLTTCAPPYRIPEPLNSFWNHIWDSGRTADGGSTFEVEVDSQLIQLFSPIFKIRKNT